jgi:hypothetical protein
MPKFILIDQSIKDSGGHYLEYATHVLNAAARAGYETCLATNRDFKGSVVYKLLTIYKYDIWGKSGKRGRVTKKIIQVKNGLRAYFKLSISKFAFSGFGQVLQCLRERNISEFMSRNSIYIIGLLLLAPVYYIYRIIRSICLLVKSILKPIVVNSYTKGIFNSLLALCKSIFSPIVIPLKNRRKIYEAVHQKRWQESYRRNTSRVLSRFGAEAHDIVFIPTLSVVDFMAIKELIKKNTAAKSVSWHLVFRRNLFTGREPEYDLRDTDMLHLRFHTYECAEHQELFGNVYFYTDTEKLTEQYARMNTVPFHTLPIPVNPKLQSGVFRKTVMPLNIVYLGDARREKGYQHLLSVVEDLWNDYVRLGKVKFDFQSNFAFADLQNNYDIVFTRQSLSQMPDFVKVRTNALNSDEYLSLVRNGDIGLLFYDRDNYYARSSGTLVECLSAGMPVIVPSGSWLAENITQDNYRFLASLRSSMKLVGESSTALKWRSAGNDSICPMQEGYLSFGDSLNGATATLVKPNAANYMYISYYVSELSQKGNFVKTRISGKDEYGSEVLCYESDDYSIKTSGEKVQILCHLPERADSISIRFSNAFLKRTLSIYDIEIGLYKADDNTIPLGAYSLCYSRYADVPMLLRNIVDNYPAFQNAAQSHSSIFREKHNAEKLIGILADNAGKAV